jgi:formamidopyrimidine-DNA glycosylase
VLEGATIAQADIRRPDLRWPFPDNMAASLTGARILRLRRRAKYILADLDRGETLLIHLGMSGRMMISAPEGAAIIGQFHHAHRAPEKHDHVILTTHADMRVTFNDARRFGAMDLTPTDQAHTHKWLAHLGAEPLGNDFNDAYLRAAFDARKTPAKTALLDQRIIAGLGNIYVSEALFRAGIRPDYPAGQISADRISLLVRAIRDVLTQAIDAGGSSLKDHRQTNGELGYFQHSFAVYGRADQACQTPGCTGKISRIMQSGRSSFFCPKCQS